MLPIITNGAAQSDYKCILKVSTQLRDLLGSGVRGQHSEGSDKVHVHVV